MTEPFITVCIPAYNRASVLPELLDSVLEQRFEDFDVLICEDASPERAQIGAIVQRYSDRYPGRLHYHENEKNLGFDGNLRRLIELARGRYCLFMGNDDLMCPDALQVVSGAISRYPKIGVFLRSFAAFDGAGLEPLDGQLMYVDMNKNGKRDQRESDLADVARRPMWPVYGFIAEIGIAARLSSRNSAMAESSARSPSRVPIP